MTLAQKLRFFSAVSAMLLLCWVLAGCSTEGGNALALTSAEQEWLDEHGKDLEVLWGYEGEPLAFHNKERRYVGLLLDYERELGERLGLRLKKYFLDNWDEMLRYHMDTPKTLIVGIMETERRAERLLFSDTFVQFPYVVVTRQNSQLEGIQDLRDRLAVTVENYAVNDFLEKQYPEIQLKRSIDHETGLKMVSSGEADAMILNMAYVNATILGSALPNLRIASEIDFVNYLSVSAHLEDRLLLGILNKAIRDIDLETHQSIYREWIAPEKKSDRLVRLLGDLLPFVLFGVFLLIVAGWVWYQSLVRVIKKKTQLVREREVLYQALWQKSNDGIFLLDRRRGFLEINDRLRDLLKIEGANVRELSIPHMVKEWSESRRIVFKAWRSLLKKRSTSFEISVLNTEESEYLCSVDCALLQLRGSWLVQGIVRDITREREAEQRLRSAMTAAEKANRVKDEFLMIMSHELRTPMNPINGYAHLLMQKAEDYEQRNLALRIIEASQRLTAIIGKILDYCDLDTDKEVVQVRKVCLAIELEVYVRGLQSKVRGLELRLDDSPFEGFEVVSSQTSVYISTEVIFRVLSEFVSNAQRFSGSSSVDIRFGVQDNRGSAFVFRMEVEDSGIGLPRGRGDEMLEPFVQGEHPLTRKHQGIGLGLAYCRKLASIAGGDIGFRSKEGGGTLFWLELPARKEVVAEDGIESDFTVRDRLGRRECR